MLSTVQEIIGLTAAQLYIVILVFITVCYAVSCLISYFRPHLRQLPGPLLARFTCLYKVYISLKGDSHIEYQKLHRKYGPIIRTGPNSVSIGDAAMIPEVYLQGSLYQKSSYITGFTFTIDGQSMENIFTSRDAAQHKIMRSSVASKYSLSSMLQLEPLFDKCIPLFVVYMDKRAGTAVDFGEWLSWFSFDLTGLLSFQEMFGFMDQARDINGAIGAGWATITYGAVVGQFPAAHKYLFGNPTLVRIIDSIWEKNPINMIQQTAYAAMKKYDLEKPTNMRGDLLEYLRQKQLKDSTIMDEREIMNNILIFFIGAVDANSTALRAIFYYLVKNPCTYAALVKELQDADAKGLLSDVLSFQEGQKLPYLQACIKEAMRMHPTVGSPFDRVVPKGGAVLNGQFIPEGTDIGITGWVTQRDKTVFGEDADFFRPERWIEVDEMQVRRMDKNMLAFGLGNRSCIGKHVAMMALTKTVGQIVRKFDMEWASEKDEWDTTCRMQVRQTGVVMRLTRREVEKEG
ncbi:hypothetical protein VC83_00506 [Pseudogymnoascus destructans]|uniref:Cytochrome P450 oxidoreductase n=2 Tax=Pseudogymnoascus destructans TaxID=655981 RepID=L8GBF8_PSED2|nr:uncharacterized protein VC83_00506 [Pseudogymnoascus destructans]ELR10417.1 hypothetical protein GMDG_00829 [Pseudogymnoascus destructans 20631-21]OAF63319.2 hypothetical protein VC83_00506 [Pseudogymnoascus destructans]